MCVPCTFLFVILTFFLGINLKWNNQRISNKKEQSIETVLFKHYSIHEEGIIETVLHKN